MAQTRLIKNSGGGIKLDKLTPIINAKTGNGLEININSKVICICGSFSMWEYPAMTLTATIDGSNITLNNNNGTLKESYGSGSGAGRRNKMQMWINNKTYKDKLFTKAKVSGTDVDSASTISVVTYK